MRLLLRILKWVLFWGIFGVAVYLLRPGPDLVSTLTQILLWGVSLAFFVAVLERMADARKTARSKGETYRIPTEPVVLMGLGFAFILLNGDLVFVEARIIQSELASRYPDIPLGAVSFAFGIALVILMGSFAKATWTHLNLEEGHWGSVRNYRAAISKHWISSAAEFWLRVSIAILVVLLQKQIARLRDIDGITEIASGGGQISGRFVNQYSKWLSETSLFGLVLFTSITVWLALASAYNYQKKLPWFYSFWGTLSLALPGIILCAVLLYVSTGSLTSTHPLSGSSSNLSFQAIMISSGIIYVMAAIALTGMMITLDQSTLVSKSVRAMGTGFVTHATTATRPVCARVLKLSRAIGRSSRAYWQNRRMNKSPPRLAHQDPEPQAEIDTVSPAPMGIPNSSPVSRTDDDNQASADQGERQ